MKFKSAKFLLLLSVVLVLSLITKPLFAVIESNSNHTQGPLMASNAVSLTVQDDKLNNTSFGYVTSTPYTPVQGITYAQTISINNTVSLRILDGFLVPSTSATLTTFKVNVSITYYTDPLKLQPSDGVTIQKTLIVTYNPKPGSTFKGIDTYDFSDLRGSSFAGAYKIDIIVNSITNPDLPGQTINSAPYLQLSANVAINRQYVFNPGALLNIIGSTTKNTVNNQPVPVNQLALSYSLLGAEEYDIEWTTIDNGDDLMTIVNDGIGLNNGSQSVSGANYLLEVDNVFRNNASRVTTSAPSYTISLMYNNDYLLFRVRQVQYTQDGIRQTGNWMYSYSDHTDPKNPKPLYSIYPLTWNETSLNWQYSAAFAENGKKKEVISYFDGTLRNRQTVTFNNSENVAIAQENIYDEFGRSVASILPAPFQEATGNTPFLHFINNFNVNNSQYPYNFRNINQGSLLTCGVAPDPLYASGTSGAAQYYSTNNPFKPASGLNQYSFIPDAFGYPISIKQYTPDNTGRVKLQGGVGPAFQPGTGKTTNYIYGKPEQWELDQLFGNDVGYAEHYLKNTVIDPNNQVSISYINASGKTIATALAGQPPANLDPLVPTDKNQSGNYSTHLQITNIIKPAQFAYIGTAQKLTATTTYTETLGNQDVTLDFNIQKLIDGYTQTGNGVTFQFCSSCYYDLKVLVTDDCGKIVRNFPDATNSNDLSLSQIGAAITDATCNDLSAYPNGTIGGIKLDHIGTYNITIELALSKSVIDYTVNNFIQKASLPGGYIISQYDYIKNNFIQNVKVDGCYSDCKTCAVLLGGETDFIAAIKNKFTEAGVAVDSSPGGDFMTWTDKVYKDLSAACTAAESTCSVQICSKYQDLMVQDMSPGGQYAVYANDGTTPLELSTNILDSHFSDVFTLGSGGSFKTTDNITLPNGTVISPNDATFTKAEMLQYWKPEWAIYFLKYHPEYCKLQFCMDNEGYSQWDDRIKTFVKTTDVILNKIGNLYQYNNNPSGLVYDTQAPDPLFLLNVDPFFNTLTDNSGTAIPGPGVNHKNDFQNDLTNYSKNVLGITTSGLNTKNIMEYIQYALYCAPATTYDATKPADATNVMPTDLTNTNWNTCTLPNQSCRAPNREWAMYQELYFQLKEKYFNKARSESANCSTLTCDVGKPIQNPLPGTCPLPSSFDLSMPSGQTLLIRYNSGQMQGDVTVYLYYPGYTGNVSITVPQNSGYATYQLPANVPLSSVHILATYCTDAKIPSGNTLTFTQEVIATGSNYYGPYETSRFSVYLQNAKGELVDPTPPPGTTDPSNFKILVNIIFEYKYRNLDEPTYNIGTREKHYELTSYRPIITEEFVSKSVDEYGEPLFDKFTCINGINNALPDPNVPLCSVNTSVVYFPPPYDLNPPPIVDNTCAVYAFKESRFPEAATFSIPIRTGVAGIIKSSSTAMLQSQISDAINGEAIIWNSKLNPGFTTSGITLDKQGHLNQTLIKIAVAGGDQNHTFGASTTPSGTSVLESNNSTACTSFAQAMLDELGLPQFTSTLNPWIISAPYPYDKLPQSIQKTISTTSPAIKARYDLLKNEYQASGSTQSFYNYLVSIYGNAMNLSSAQFDALTASLTTCNFVLDQDLVLPVFLNPVYDNTSRGCINYTGYSAAKAQLLSQFSSLSTTDPNYKTIITNYMNQNWGLSLTYSDYYPLDILTSAPAIAVEVCDIPLAQVTPDPYACMESAYGTAIANGVRAYNDYITNEKNLFRTHYINTCSLAGGTFNLTANVQTYHYTLYYYDQADNLVRTVPPEGVHILNSTDIAQVQAYRDQTTLNPTVTPTVTDIYPAHILTTNYAYNSTNQVTQQQSPDGNVNRFWYDLLSRLVLSQNDKQADATNQHNKYSYTVYDILGRINEVGEKNIGANPPLGDPGYLDDGAISSFNALTATNAQVTHTYYDDLATNLLTGVPLSVAQDNLRKRVSASTYQYSPTDNLQATYFNYDIDGNVKTLYQQIGGLGLKQIDYEYDLVSGKVNFVRYQDILSANDRFYYKYDYDAENRLIKAWSGTQALVDPYHGSELLADNKRMDASYSYYLHGPLSRMELGDELVKVQGMDYAYTLQGWLKGVNSQSLGSAAYTTDMGGDGFGSSAKTFPADVMAYSLGYYKGDYNAVGGNTANAFSLQYSPASGDVTGQDLFNGNISNSLLAVLKLSGGDKVGYTYHYDQLNRLKKMRQHTQIGNVWNKSSVGLDYQENVGYDANGNILNYYRNGNTLNGSNGMDDLTYVYDKDAAGNLKNNRLLYITDGVTTNAHTADLKTQPVNNYAYDAIGNLTADQQAGITNIDWTVYGKIKGIAKTGSNISYDYDAAGHRVSKTIGNITTYYVRDAQGNPLAIYDQDSKANTTTWTEQHLYGSSRLGMWAPNIDLTKGGEDQQWQVSGLKQYELTNHLGNVMATITDRRIQVPNVTVVDHYVADLATAQDYYPFGMLMPGRTYASGSNTTTTTTTGGGTSAVNTVVPAQSVHFDGTENNDYPVDVLNYPNTFTMELWVNPEGTIVLNNETGAGPSGVNGQRYAVFPAYRGGTGSDDNAGMGISVGTNGISVYEHAGNYLPPLLTWPVAINGWTHIAVVYNNKSISLYINGAFAHQGQTSPKTNVYPGYSIGNGNYYGGYIGGLSDMRIWGTVRSPAQIAYDMHTEVPPKSQGLEGDWTFGGSNQPLATVNDETGNGHPITLPAGNYGGQTMTPPVPPNIKSAPLNNTVAALVQSLHLDGSERNTSALNAVPVTNTFTMELWAKPQGTIILNNESTTGGDGLQGQQYAVFPSYRAGTNDDSKSGMGISVGTNGVSVYEHSAAELAPLLTWSSGTTSLTSWTHIAVVYNNGTPSLYINGTLVHTGIQSQKTVSPSYNIGEGSAYYGPYTGNLSELHIWGTALGAAQIQADMVTEVSPTQPGLLADWTFDGTNQPGSQVTDLTGNQYTITLPQAGTSGQTDVPPVSGMSTGGGTGGTTTASTGQGRYRYGFNGKENDNEVKGVGNQQDYGMRIYDPRVGRFLSVDPLGGKFPFYTPYQFAGDKPIENTDLDGAEEIRYNLNLNKQGKTQLQFLSKQDVEQHSVGGWTYSTLKIPERYVVTYNGSNYYIGFNGIEGAGNQDAVNLFKVWKNGLGDAQTFERLFYSKTESVEKAILGRTQQAVESNRNMLAVFFATSFVTDPVTNEQHTLGKNGEPEASRTVWNKRGSNTARIDIENPNPSQRAGSIHYQDENNVKYQYSVDENVFYDKDNNIAPKAVNNLLKDKSFQKGINKALKYLGEKEKNFK